MMQEKQKAADRKAEQRREVLQRRDELAPEQREKDSRRICEQILCADIYRRSDTILLFKAFGSEADLSVFEKAAQAGGKTLLYPFCPDREQLLPLKAGDTWETDRFGIRVPVRKDAEEADPSSIDLILCPCAGFDDSGGRLGMGKGYYDRFFPKCPQAFRLLVAFEAQRLEKVVTEPWDARMDGIVTESRLLLF
jgi:5-formyltetrahydrofolate cyclo-ligase